MGTNWIKIYTEAEGCQDFGEIEKLLMNCHVEKSRVFSLVKKALSNYSYNRDYREKRNQSMTTMRKRIIELESQAKSK